MTELLVLITIVWVLRRILAWILLRMAAFVVGFVLGWRLMNRR